jgi:cyclophilin family peptidyl-prolyl cis-trans isomerase
VLVQLQQMFPDEVRLVFRQFPLSFHDKSNLAAQASEAADMQGKFAEMKNLIFDTSDQWLEMSTDDFVKWVTEQAGTLGLDVDKFAQDMQYQAVTDRIQEDLDEGSKANVGGTPTVYINGSLYQGQRSLEIFSAIVKLFELKGKQYTSCPPTVIDTGKQYTATLKTSKGDIVIELYPDKAPITVNSFVFLAQNGWFDNDIFTRVEHNFVAQAGDPLGIGIGGPGYAFKDEISPDLNFDEAGVVGMANSGPNTNGSQFFITFAAQPDLDGKYPVFGKVIQGMDVLQSLSERSSSQEGPLPEPDTIYSITIKES